MTKVGILVCDEVDESLREQTGGDLTDIYTRLLHSVDPLVEACPYRVFAGVFPESPDECDAWIITGSRFSVYDDEPWIAELLAFIQALDAARSRTVGVCFGHQAIAEALGGEVGPAGVWKVGVHSMEVESQPWFKGASIRLHAMHRDVVSRLPNGATVIAEGSSADIPAYRVGDHILAFQDHPEYDAVYERLLIERRRHLIGDHDTDVALASLGGDTENFAVAGWILAFLKDVRIEEDAS